MGERFQSVGSLFNWLKSRLFSWTETSARRLDEQIVSGLTLRVDRNGYELFSGGKSRRHFANTDELGFGLRSALDEIREGRTRKINLHFARKQYLYRPLSDVTLPDYRVSELAEMDSVMQTPFKRQDIVLLNDAKHGGGRGYFLLKKSLIEPIVSAVKSAGLRCDLVSFSGQDAAVFPAHVAGEPLGRRASPWTGKLLVAGIVAMMLGSAAHFQLRYDAANQELDAKIASLNVEVAKIRASIAEQDRQDKLLANVMQLKNSTPSRVKLWEELSRILPDGSWLAALNMGEGTIKATGYSKSAASLIEIINSSPHFSEAAFDGSVVSIANRDVQRFTIKAGVAAP